MIYRYTITRNPRHRDLVKTMCECYMTPSAYRALAADCWNDGLYSDAAWYAQAAELGQPWEKCWSEQDYTHAIPNDVVSKLRWRGLWHGAEPKAKPIVYTVCEY